MKNLSLTCLSILAAGALTGIVVACSSDTTNAGTADGGPTTTNNPEGGSTTNPDGGSTTNPEGGGSTGTAISSCTTATLFAGDPLYDAPDPSTRPADGTGILTDPPFQWGNLSFVGNILYTRDTGEIWYTDTSAAAPVEKHLLGSNNSGSSVAITFGACAQARVGAIQGIADLPDGSLVAADAFGNEIIHITSPQAAGCSIESWAGTNTSTSFDGTDYPNIGDVDGAVGTSKIEYPTAITTDGAGTVFFYDSGAKKFKKIANDTAHTTSTVVAMPDGNDICYGMVHIGTTIYALGYDGNQTSVYKIVGTAITKVAGGDGSAWEGLDGKTPQLGGITTDGTNIIVAGEGYVYLVNVTSGVIKQIAGSGEIVDLPSTAKAPTTAAAVVLKPKGGASAAAVGSPDYLGFKDGAIYYRGHGDSTAAYVEKIQCQ